MRQANTYGVGIDLGGTNFAVGVFDAWGKLVTHASYDTPVTEDPQVVVEALAAGVRATISSHRARMEQVVGLAVGFPGPVSPDTGRVRKAPNLPCLAGYPLTEALSQLLGGVRVSLQNDAYCATLAELRWGAGKAVDNLVMLTLGTGIGGGIALNNQVVRGPRQIMGEVGHMIVDPNGRQCGCGNFGCFEAVAAKQAIIELAARAIQSGRATILSDLVAHDQSKLTPEIVSQAAHQGDAAAVAIYEQIGFYVGIAICNCIVLCDPDLVLIGGGIAAAGDVLWEPIRRTVRARSLISGFDVSRIIPAKFANLAGVYGAGALAWEQARGAGGHDGG